jgi:hypothetical protein
MAGQRSGLREEAPLSFWAVGVIALLWNGLGTILWGGTSLAPDTFLAGMPADHRAYVESLPAWTGLTWGLGVVAGLVGSILLLLRNRLAIPAFALSLAGAVINCSSYLVNRPPPGFFNPVLTAFILGFAAFLLWFAHRMKGRGLL